MKRALITTLTVLICTGPVFGQTPNLGITCNPDCTQGGTTATAASGASAKSHSSSTSSSRATGAIAGTQVNAPITTRSQGGNASVVVVNRTGGGGGRGGYTPASSTPASDPAATDPPGPVLGSGGNPLTENIGGTTTVRNTPEIVAPNISGGNPCLVGVSGGGAGPGIGITLGFGYSDKGCERRNDAAVLSNLGQKEVAVALMCQDGNVRQAFLAAGHPCPQDQRVATLAPTQAMGVDPAIIRREQEVAQVPPTNNTPVPIAQPPKLMQVIRSPKAKPDWCYTTEPNELKSHPECR